MTSDIVIIALNSQYIHSSLAPWYLAAGLRQYGIDRNVEVLELNINQPVERLLAEIALRKPRLAGFCCYIWNIDIVLKLADALKVLLPGTMNVLGGPEVSDRAASLLSENSAVDYVVSGSGEYAFSLLCKDCAADSIPGLAYRDGTGTLSNPIIPLPEPAPSPYLPEYFEAIHGRISYIEASRGCPFSCAFCLSGGESGVSFFPMDQVKDNLLRLAQSGTQTVKFVDRTFNCNPSRAQEIWQYIISLNREGRIPGVCFHFEIGADLLDDESIALLGNAPRGLFQLEAGLQSFNSAALASCCRKTDLGRLERNLRSLIRSGNIHVHADLIAGLPMEDLSSFFSSFDRAYALQPHMLQLGFLKLIHGTRLRMEAAQYGYRFTPYPPYEVLANDFISFEDLQRLKAMAQALDRLYNSGSFRRTLAYIISTSGRLPHEILEELGILISESGPGLSQGSLCRLVLDAYARDDRIEPAALRDVMTVDILSTTPNGNLPECLQVRDARLRAFKHSCREAYPGITIQAAGILYHGKIRGILVDHDIKDPVTGQGRVMEIPLPA